MITANMDLLLTIASAGVYLLLLILSWVLLTPKPNKKLKIEILNDGNVVSNYLVSLAPYNPAVKYRIQRDGVRLDYHEDEEAFEEEPLQDVSSAEEGSKPKAVALLKREPTKLSGQASNAAQTGKKALGMAGALSNILGILGTILPGSAGRYLKARATQIRNSQAKASRTMAAPRQTKSQLRALQGSADQISGGKASAAGEKSTERMENIDSTAPKEEKSRQKKQKKQKKEHPSVYCTLVEELSPGTSAILELLIVQKKRNQIEPGFLMTFESLQQPLEDSETALAPICRQTAVNFDPIAFWRWMPPVALSLILTAALIWALWFWIGL